MIWLRMPLASAGSDLSAGARLTFAQALLLDAAGDDASWDPAVQSYLGTRAITDDFARRTYPQAPREIAAVQAALADLGKYLDTDCFPTTSQSSGPPTQYDGPTAFTSAAWIERAGTAREALKQLQSAVSPR